MIRALQKADIDSVAEIWLDTNRKAHAFIPASYWERNFASVKQMLPQAEIYVYETDQGIQGFLGLNGEYIEGIFVSEAAQSHGIGKCLLDCAKDRKPALRLNVYQKNVRAIRFYQREGFQIRRSALDAVELMNTGVQYLREHMDSRARIHYAITDAGGRSPNVVQAKASVLYMVRSDKVKKALELQARVDKIAEGAALMTETTCERKFIDGLAETIPNHALEAVLYRNFEQTGVPAYTQAEAEFAEKIAASYDAAGHLPGTGSEDSAYAAQVQTLLHGGAMNDVLLPLYQGEAFCPGSTDVGDVSWECPTAQLHVAAWPNGCPGHSWQNVSCAKSDTGRKAALYAGKVLCGAAIDLMESPEILQTAQAEFRQRTAAGYSCPIPPDAVPTIAD